MFSWWVTIFPFALLPHWKAIGEVLLQRWQAIIPVAAPPRPRVAASFFLLGSMAAVALVLTSATGRWLLSQQPRPLEQQVSTDTPVRLMHELKAWIGRQATGVPLRVFHTVLWSDYLVWELPPSASVFWYSHWHCYGVERANDGTYLLALEPPPHDWRKIVDRYRFNVMVLQRQDPPSPLFVHLLAEEGRPGAEWEIIYKDNPESGAKDRLPAGIVAVRRVDPFLLSLANAEAVQGCMGGLGMAAGVMNWSVLTHLPWTWAK
jgi:hypothetical protein